MNPLALILAGLLLQTSPAAIRQEPPAAAAAFAHVDGRLLVNRTVYVQTAELTRDQRGYGIKGKVLKISASTVWLKVKGKVREFPAADVLVISERHDGAKLGALIGCAAGVGTALLLTGSETEWLILAVPMLGGLGAMTGGGSGAQFKTERVLFLASDLKPDRRLSGGVLVVRPVVSRRAAGLGATFRF